MRRICYLVAWALPTVGAAQTRCDSATIRSLPLIERPALMDTNQTLVLLLTGDGGWAGADEKVSDGLRARGAAVIGVNMRSYLSGGKTPAQVSVDVGCVAEVYGARWKRNRLLLLGYSRGADIAPFVVSRWPESLRGRLNMVAMISLGPRANFTFHFIDIVRDVERDDDVQVAPELERLRGLRMVCVYGNDETTSGCRGVDPTLMKAYGRAGGHRLTEGFDGVASILSEGLRPPS